jgi:hypothetical protein
MEIPSYVYPIALTLLLSYLYTRHNRQQIDWDSMRDYKLVHQFLLTTDEGTNVNKPFLWIHSIHDINARQWLDFYSRNTTNLNQPYLYLTIKSIMDKCRQDFNVCLIDDASFAKLLPEWGIDLSRLAEPVKSKFRQLAFAKLLHMYGGLMVPSSLICFKSLRPVFDAALGRADAVVGEFVVRSSPSDQVQFFPDTKLLGCVKDAKVMADYIHYLEPLLSTDFVAESDFYGQYGRWFYEQIWANRVALIPAEMLGVKDTEGRAIIIDRLLADSYVDLSHTAVALFVPSDEILRRTNFQWFARMSPEQVLQSNTQVGKYLLLSHGA